MLTNDEVIRRIKETHAIRRWYQKVPYGEVPYPIKTHFEDGKTDARSFGEGRWRNYVRPAVQSLERLDPEHSTLCEIGCSAGLFLLRAWQEFKFKRLIGVEAANGGFEQLLITRDYYDEMPLLTYKTALGELTPTIADSDAAQFDASTFPIVDVTLMSCVHYHMELGYLKQYVRLLADKSMYLVLLTDENAGGPTNATSKFFDTQVRGREWLFQRSFSTVYRWLCANVKPPCKNLTVFVYKSAALKRLLVDECYNKQTRWHAGKGGSHAKWNAFVQGFYRDVFPRFIDDVLGGRTTEVNYEGSETYRWQLKNWTPAVAAARTRSYLNMVQSIHSHGQEQPIGLQEHLSMVDPWDGWHRVAVLKHLGFKYVYGKDVVPEGS